MAAEAKYNQVTAWIKEQIESGVFRQGDRLPSEKELSERFGLSRQTIRHATGDLEAEGLLTRVRGSGTYIGSAPVRSERQSYHNIGLISTLYENYIFPPTIKGIERVLSKNGYTLQVSFTDNRVSRERTILENILEKDNIDGLIVEPAKSSLPNPNLGYYRELMRRGVPVIFFNAIYPDISCPCVRLDDEAAAYEATRILVEAGHTEIGGIFKCDDRQGHLRYSGFMRALTEQGVRISTRRALWIDTPETEHLADLEDYLLKRMEGVTALVCYNDNVAYQVAVILKNHGIRIPEEISLVGIDDASESLGAHLTTVPHPKGLLGKKVAENLLQMIAHPGFDGNYLYQPDPVLRESVKEMK